MILIPVIDLAAGQVVHARGGERSKYLPLHSPLCRSSSPADVVAGLLSLYPFSHLYIADLDAITRSGDHSRLIAQLHEAFPALQLWIDAGIGSRADYLRLRDRLPGTLVAGSETLADTALLESDADRHDIVLSLDYRDGRALGPIGIAAHPELWPARTICMMLDRVGSGRGPDLALLQQLQRDAPQTRIFAAGGIRGADDLAQLHECGVDGALLASALHDGHVDATQLQRFGQAAN